MPVTSRKNHIAIDHKIRSASDSIFRILVFVIQVLQNEYIPSHMTDTRTRKSKTLKNITLQSIKLSHDIPTNMALITKSCTQKMINKRKKLKRTTDVSKLWNNLYTP